MTPCSCRACNVCGILGLARVVQRPPPMEEAKAKPQVVKPVVRKKRKRVEAPNLFGHPSELNTNEVDDDA